MDILLLDDHVLVRKGIKLILVDEEKENQVEEASNIKEALGIMERKKIDLAFIEPRLNGETGFEFIERLRKKKYAVKIIMIASSYRESDWEKAEELGVDGYIVKDSCVNEISYAVKKVMQNGNFYSPELMRKILKEKKMKQHLTKREQEVLENLQYGYTNAEIGRQLCISEATVKKHVSSILSKLELNTRVEAALYRKEGKE